MLNPDRHMNPDYSVINISANILNEIKISKSISYDDLLEKIISKINIRCKENYPYALNFLFLLDKIFYNVETDCFNIKS